MTERLDLTVSGLLLDMDGTLVDSNALVELIWAEFAAKHALDLPEILLYSHGRPSIDTVRRMLPDSPPSVHWRERDFIEAEGLRRTDGVGEVRGAVKFMSRVAESAIPVAVVTSAPRELAAHRFAAAGIALPELTVTADDVTVGKPDPQPFVLGAELLGLRPAACAAFEDSGAGLRSARDAGAATVVVGTYNGPEAAGLARIPDWDWVHIDRVEAGFRLHTKR